MEQLEGENTGVIMQGEMTSSILDKISKYETRISYKYKGPIPVPIIGFDKDVADMN